jgi:zinc D-Ala-D-Ala dipeptidase
MLVEIAPPHDPVTLEIAYATAENFTAKPIYRRAACYLRPEAVERLRAAIELAAALDLRFKIFDAYRPPEAQWAMWNHSPDPEFLADPRRGSPHSRGVAVDLTLLAADGTALDMGTAFDAFTPLSHHGDRTISPEAQRNRHLLLGLMTAAGWDFYRNEWWHYQLFDARRYPLIADGALAPAMM